MKSVFSRGSAFCQLLIFAWLVGMPCPARADQEFVIWIPQVHLKNATLEEAMDYVRDWTKRVDPEHKGINFVLKPTAIEVARSKRVTLDLSAIRIEELLYLFGNGYGVKVRYESSAVFVVPKSDPDPLRTLHISVPADFCHMGEVK